MTNFKEFIVCIFVLKPSVFIFVNNWFLEIICFDYFFKGKDITYTGVNVKESSNTSLSYDKKTIYIISADFSHHKLFHDAINLENKAAKSMMFRDYSDTGYNQVVDDLRTFKYVNKTVDR